MVLQALSTGEELDDLLSAPRMVLTQFVEKWFPCDPDGEEPPSAGMNTKMLKRLLLDVSEAVVTTQLHRRELGVGSKTSLS